MEIWVHPLVPLEKDGLLVSRECIRQLIAKFKKLHHHLTCMQNLVISSIDGT